MEPQSSTQPLPRTSPKWVALVLVSAVLVAIGAYAFFEQTKNGFILTGMRNTGRGEAGWGLYICFDVYFVGVSFAGITVAALARLFDIKALKPITRIAELLTITALIAGAGVVVSDLGRPLDGLIKLPRYANPSSPFYGTFTLVVAGYLFSSLVYFFLAGRADAGALAAKPDQRGRWFYWLWASGYRDRPAQRARHRKVSFWLALTILPLLITAHSTLGLIFGLQSGRPGWFSALQAPAFVVLAGVSGIGMVIVAGAAFRRLFKLKSRLPDSAFGWLGNLLWVLALVYLYFMIVEELTATYLAPSVDRQVAHSVVTGPYAYVFWLTVGSLFLTFLIPFVLYLRRRTSAGWLVTAGLLANVAAVLKRFLIVVPSQTHGSLLPVDPPSTYAPSWIEYAVVVGLAALIALTMLLFGRVFPLVPGTYGSPPPKPPPTGRRWIPTTATVAVAAVMIIVGLADSFRLFSGESGDPRIPYSPVLFAAGVMLMFISAIVYEVFPSRWVPPLRPHIRAPRAKPAIRALPMRVKALRPATLGERQRKARGIATRRRDE